MCNACARNSHVEAILNHPFPAQVVAGGEFFVSGPPALRTGPPRRPARHPARRAAHPRLEAPRQVNSRRSGGDDFSWTSNSKRRALVRLFDARLDYGPRDGSRKFAAWAAETARDARPKAVGFKWMLSQQFGEAFEAWRVGGAGAARRPEASPAQVRDARAVEARAPRVPQARRPAWNSNLQPDFNVRVIEPDSSAMIRELDESNRSVQKSAKATSI